MGNITKVDPIRDKYYKPLEIAELVANALFYISALASLIIPFVNPSLHPALYKFSQASFLFIVVTFGLVNLAIRLYFAPRAQVSRYKDFLSHAYSIPLGTEQTDGYYNNNEKEPARRIAAQALENSFYSKNTIQQMVKWERAKFLGYFFLWLVAIINRDTDLTTLAIGAQIIFSEQIISRAFRMEWLRVQFESIFDSLFQLFSCRVTGASFEVQALELVGKYEIAKANASLTLSSKVFEKQELEADKGWAKTKETLGL